NWLRPSAGIHGLEEMYQRHLNHLRFGDAPLRPRYIFNATDLVFGANFMFDTGGQDRTMRVGDDVAGYTRPPSWLPLSRAIAASSGFPPAFHPMPYDLPADKLLEGRYRGRDRKRLISKMRLSDGGTFDNMGVEPVWTDHQTLVVSDGGAVLDAEPHSRTRGMKRFAEVASHGGSSIRKRWLISDLESGIMNGTYWGIGGSPSRYGASLGYSKQLAREVISEVRTDLDAFSVEEIGILENHGYLLADAAIRKHMAHFITCEATLAVPHPQWLDEAAVRYAMSGSNHRSVLGRW
ncbi:MAG: hypothetical protein ABR548_06780, partial [Actinomycetota bacterium]